MVCVLSTSYASTIPTTINKRDQAMITLPCGHTIDEAQILTLAGRINRARRGDITTPYIAERCACGKHSAAYAERYKRVCALSRAAKPATDAPPGD